MPVPRLRIPRIFFSLASLCLASGSAALQPAVAPPCPGEAAGESPLRGLGTGSPRLLLDANFPDPFVARFDGAFHAYATGAQLERSQANVQYIRSRNLAEWSAPAEALPAANLPAWVDRSHPQVWAPEVASIGGRYVLYFNARHAALTRTETPPDGPRVLQRHCLGAAVANAPEGPFQGIDAPLVCAEFANGVIDANVFRDGEDGALYLYYKEDGNCCGPGSAIYVQGLSTDGLAALGAPIRLVASNDSPDSHDDWEWRVVEAPTMVRRDRDYHLFYSGNFFGNANYAVAYLSCASPRGPCRDNGDNPILRSHDESPLIGPGHQSLLEHAGRTLIFFHGWNADPDGREQTGVHRRCLYVGQVDWEKEDGGTERPRVVGGAASRRPAH
ncbi:MAG TPA: glycoside hydrolase family 43 protein [Allosphingosinicella sp.]|nr:glycoside hydrolase family 43 protein [Allosphingosinicella sp.]